MIPECGELLHPEGLDKICEDLALGTGGSERAADAREYAFDTSLYAGEDRDGR